MRANGTPSFPVPEVVVDRPRGTGARWATVVIGTAGLALGAIELAVGIPRVDPPDHLLFLHVLVGWAFLGSAILALARRPRSPVGRQLAAVGFLWFLELFILVESSLAVTLGLATQGVFWLPLVHLFLSFPSGRLDTRFDRFVVAALYVLLPLMNVLTLLFVNLETASCLGCPENLLMVRDDPELAMTMMTLDSVSGAAFAVTVLFRFIRRWRSSSGASRRALQPVIWGIVPGLAAVVYFVVAPLTGQSPELEDILLPLVNLAMAGLPLGFLVGLLRSQLDLSLVGDLLIELKSGTRHASLRDALGRALGDPTLQLAFWLPESGRYVDEDGRSVTIPETDRRQATRIHDSQHQPLAVLVHDPAVAQDPRRVEAVASAARLALENERLHADLRAQLEEVRASRRRVVTAGDEARRRLERDLHDGAQQRLLAISAALERVRAMDVVAPSQRDVLSEIAGELREALVELRDLARGIHPTLLTDEGIGPAVESLGRRAQIATRVVQVPKGRLHPSVEATAYFVVAEALANAVRHSGASEVTIEVRHGDDTLLIRVADDGQGGASLDGGSGLRGMLDRVLSLGGSLDVDSQAGLGTVVTATVPTSVVSGS